MITAFEALARITSLSLMPPTAECSTRIDTSLVDDLFERADDRLERALHIRFDDDRQFFRDAGRDLREHLLEGAARAGCGSRVAPAALTEIGDVARAALVFGDDEIVAGERRAVEAQHLDRRRGTRLEHGFARDRRPARAPGPIRCRRQRCRRRCSVPRWISTVATAPRPRSSLASSTTPSAGRFGLALRSSSSACSRIASSSLSRLVFLSAETSTSSTSPPSSSTTSSCCSSSWRTRSGLRIRPVHLVDGDDDRHLRRLGVADRLDRLLHDAVIGGDDQHDDVGDIGAARAHRGEGLMARRVDKGDLLAALQRRR